jgi:tRNA-Thr(GGU) m(6)t(6)A37 methyltransferase TsaA
MAFQQRQYRGPERASAMTMTKLLWLLLVFSLSSSSFSTTRNCIVAAWSSPSVVRQGITGSNAVSDTSMLLSIQAPRQASRSSRLYSGASTSTAATDDDDDVDSVSEDLAATSSLMTIQPVGVVRSIYQLSVGTPRQGLLAPHARGRIELNMLPDIATDAVAGLEEFSHVWIVFLFHLNTSASGSGAGDEHRRRRAKIAPPALGGKKVGVFATRSPHRFNPLGMTLVKLDRIQVHQTHVQGRKPVKTVCLHVSGLDLVDGTPVVDIKPYVPDYDGVPIDDNCKLPTWVSGGLATKRVVCVADEARQELRNILHENESALEFYGGAADESPQVGFENVLQCIEEVLAIDVRSEWQTKKARQGKSQADRAARLQHVSSSDAPGSLPSTTRAECTQQIDNLLITYTIEEATETERPTSQGSGAEDKVIVTSVLLLKNNNRGGRQINSGANKR